MEDPEEPEEPDFCVDDREERHDSSHKDDTPYFDKIEKYLKGIKPDYEKPDNYQHGFYDAIEVVEQIVLPMLQDSLRKAQEENTRMQAENMELFQALQKPCETCGCG